MNRVEQIKDISNRTGLAEAIIRQVWSGTRDSIVDSLIRNENYDLYGMCSFKPLGRMRINPDTGETEEYKSVKVSVSKILKKDINQGKDYDSYSSEEVELNEIDPDVLTFQLASLK